MVVQAAARRPSERAWQVEAAVAGRVVVESNPQPRVYDAPPDIARVTSLHVTAFQ